MSPHKRKKNVHKPEQSLLYKQITRVTLNEVSLEFANKKNKQWEKEVLTEMHNIFN
jgi:hypothetical protein